MAKKDASFLWLLGLTAVLLTSCCCHDDDDDGKFPGVNTIIDVRFDWSAAPTASPSLMMLTAFAPDAQPVQIPLDDWNGGWVTLPENNYRLIAFNEAETFTTEGDKWDAYEICCKPTELSEFSRVFSRSTKVPRAAGTDDEEMVMEPDQLWTAADGDVRVRQPDHQVVSMTMEVATVRYRFTIRNVENIDYISEAVATLSGMALSWLPAQHRCSDRRCIIPFSLTKSLTSLTGSVRTFGYFPTAAGTPHKLVVYMSMTNGQKYYYSFDISDMVNRSEPVIDDSGRSTVTITIDELPVPKPMTNGSGVQADVEEWQEVTIPLYM